MLFVSGQLPVNKTTGNFVPGKIIEQTHQSLENIKAILSEAGCTFSDVIKTNVFLKDMNDFTEMNDVYAKFFTSNYPARACVEVARLPKDALVEIELVAICK